jgi:hypothetical protein
MFTLHLSKRLPSSRPNANLQKLNALIHDNKPLSILLYGIFWISILSFGAPLVAAILPFVTLFWLIEHAVWNHKLIEPKSIKDKEFAVIITGCDTGFAAELVHRLVEQGFVVFAACLKRDSLKSYEQEGQIIPLLLDVTDEKQVDYAAQKVNRWLDSSKATKKRILHALVNNAGMGKGGYIDWLELSDFQVCMDGK